MVLRTALELAERSRGQDHPTVAHPVYLAGQVAMLLDDPKRALSRAVRALELAERSMGRMHMSLTVVLRLVGEANLELGKLGDTETAFRRTGELYMEGSPAGSALRGLAPMLLGDVAMKRKAYATAAELFEQALAIGESAYGSEDDQRLGKMLDRAGEAQLQNGGLARAEALSERLLEMCKQVKVGVESRALVAVLGRLATL